MALKMGLLNSPSSCPEPVARIIYLLLRNAERPSPWHVAARHPARNHHGRKQEGVVERERVNITSPSAGVRNTAVQPILLDRLHSDYQVFRF